ncbi:Bicarbonate transport system permease protein CmpB [Hyphomicrobium sp. ghe19]|nr:Bicarbonate transport system permease protein CmpB [Hyphomicrobium sp. ghe19]
MFCCASTGPSWNSLQPANSKQHHMARLLNTKPSQGLTIALGTAPFLAVATVYAIASAERLLVNARDNLLPSLQSMFAGLERVGFVTDPVSGHLVFLTDTLASLERLGIGLGIAAAIGLIIGLAVGLIPIARATLAPFISVLSIIPPITLLPILFIAFGLGDVSKIILIVIGITPFIARDIASRTQEIPEEMLIKAQTLYGSTWLITLHVVLPQIFPRLLESIRLSLGPAWLFVLSGEAIAAQSGLGYRIFLVRRYMAMDVIIPYVIWIGILAFTLDLALRWGAKRLSPWSQPGNTR